MTSGVFSPAVQEAVRIITACEPLVRRVGELRAANGAPLCEVEFDVSLPSRLQSRGVGEHSVRAFETVTFYFGPTFPFKPPFVLLRDDFNRALAHIQPGSAAHPPQPCLVDGDLAEVYHSEGLVGVVQQVGDWLRHAASGSLIDPAQGWEPVRRDSSVHRLVADIDELRSLVTRGSGIAIRRMRFGRLQLEGQRVYQCAVTSDAMRLDKDSLNSLDARESLALIIWAGKDARGDELIVDRYLPETVTSLSDLRARAADYKCDAPLKDSLRRLAELMKGFTASMPLPLVVVFAVRRPFHLIGSDSRIELCPYLMEVGAPAFLPGGDGTLVHSIAPEDVITHTLLKRMSGLAQEEGSKWVQFGAGSLGSKVALHLARAGCPPASVVDRGWLAPRNAARHALISSGDVFELYWRQGKAEALANAIVGLGGGCEAHSVDLAAIAVDRKLIRKIVPKGATFVVNSTASLTVRAALEACFDAEALPPVVETVLFAAASHAVMSIEGPDHNPSCGDLITDLYAEMVVDAALAGAMAGDADGVARVEIGQGCGSFTMTASDAQISRFAAPMAHVVMEIQQQEPFRGAEILLGRVDDDGISARWSRRTIGSTHRVQIVGEAFGWHVRVLDRAHQQIVAATTEWPNVETGGILVGRVAHAARIIYVADVLPAPPDSTRTADEFVLGKVGAEKAIATYHATTNQTLYCVGTWHSHLSVSGPSAQDRGVAEAISLSRLIPAVVLVRTPHDYRGLIATAKRADRRLGAS